LESFYAAQEDASASNDPLQKENICVPHALNEGRHKNPAEFKSHVMSFTDIKTVVARISGGKALTQI